MTNKFTELVVRTASPFSLFQVNKQKQRGFAQDVDVTTVYEHGWKDSAHFKWMLPDGRYWLICGIPGTHHIRSIVVAHPKATIKKMKEFDLAKWRKEQSS
jgi:hypothetical protein